MNKGAGIFLIFGISPTIIESQVILTCLALKKEGINIEIWAFCPTLRLYKTAQRQLAKWNQFGIPFLIFRSVRSSLPFSEIINAFILGYLCIWHKKRPPFIHCRTEYPTVIAMLLRILTGSKVIWDARGDTVSEYRLYINELPTIARIFSPVTLIQIRTRLMLSKKYADRCIFVSESLRDLYFKKEKNNSLVIPCVAEQNHFYFSSDLRYKTRIELGIQLNEVVLIYSGSMAFWQCIDETINLIENHLKSSDNHKAIVLTPEVDIFLNRINISLRSRVICFSVSLLNVNRYLNAADYAIFLRKKNSVNKVASPVKFAEYSLAGLPIIMTDAVDQAFEYAVRIGNQIQCDLDKGIVLNEIFNDDKRLSISTSAELLLSRNKIIKSLIGIYKS